MADDDSITPADTQEGENEPNPENPPPPPPSDDDDYTDSDYESGDSDLEEVFYTRPGEEPDPRAYDNKPETNIMRFTRILESRRMKKMQEEEEKEYVFYEDLFDFPEDPEKWREEDLKELWADAPLEMTKPGWDPVWADEEEWEIVKEESKAGRDPPTAPFMCRIGSRTRPFQIIIMIFLAPNRYEGTVWDDLAHGKGVYVAEQGLVRYEGEWLQNNMEGHGVVEVEIPDMEPVPGSKLEMKMRAEGKIISRDFMTPEDKEWLEMDIEDSINTANGNYEIPFYENDEWIKQFGRKPFIDDNVSMPGRKVGTATLVSGSMAECMAVGRFYFGELLEDFYGCDENTSALHSGIAEVAAAKARMFINKPDGMVVGEGGRRGKGMRKPSVIVVREERGPYSDPQHPYFYEEEDVWMAPGFINQFYEVPDYWKTYVSEVDQEREMWLNSFYKAPLRIPMPAELEHWWSKGINWRALF
ncbi:Protein TIC 100 [Vitis vinifera]|uniref:Protein TIC 100 n=1 Tax=Vitis vinifera TaxID=29760 RepID=A0A438KGE0_VITVI|nr:Protein TIC 100 [Vitis vinifera]